MNVGDKLQTAIEIGYSCNLLKSTMDLMILSADSAEKTRAQLEAGLNKIASVLGPPSWDLRKRGFIPGAQASFAVVIDGDTLRHALTPELKTLFLNLGTQCETVVCCRVSPAQKALTVNLVSISHICVQFALLMCTRRVGQGRTKRHDTFDWRRRKRCCHDSGG